MSYQEMMKTGLIYMTKPTYVLVDKTGKVVFKGIGGFSPNLEEAKKSYENIVTPEINKLLDN